MVGLHPGCLPGRPEPVRSLPGTVLVLLMPLFSALSFLLARESRSLSPARAAPSSCSSLVHSSSEAFSPASAEAMPASRSAAPSEPSAMPARCSASPRDLRYAERAFGDTGQPPAAVAFRIRTRPVGGCAPILRHEPTIEKDLTSNLKCLPGQLLSVCLSHHFRIFGGTCTPILITAWIDPL